MTRILLIPCGKTFWDQEGRLAGAADLPLSDQGHQEVEETARRLMEIGPPQVIYTGSGQAEVETLQILEDAVGSKTKVFEGLEEPDMGLWEGLTTSELQQRNPKAFKQLAEEPTQVSPPSGEPLGDAQERLVNVISRITQKHPDQTVGLVVGPLAVRLLNDWICSEGFEQYWQGRQKPEIVVLKCDKADPAPVDPGRNGHG